MFFLLKGKLEENALAVLERANKRERKHCANDVIYLTARTVLHHVISTPMPMGDLHYKLLDLHLRTLFLAFFRLYILACFCGCFSVFCMVLRLFKYQFCNMLFRF